MLKLSLCGIVSIVSIVSGAIIPRDDPSFQSIPTTSQPDNTFNNGKERLNREPDVVPDIPSAVYGARSIDIPFGRLYHGNLKYFKQGQLNTPDGITDRWQPGVNDFANQSACGIPDNAFHVSKVAIHPYFLKYADLSRYCMQDVCISFWKEDGRSDMMLKVTDICDPADCATPADIKVDRSKVQVMEHLTGKPLSTLPKLTGDGYPEKTWWFFTKCWADGLAQPVYHSPPANNWFTTPHLPNNIKWAMKTVLEQHKNNQVAYKAKGWPTYPQGAYKTQRDDTTSPPITDWVPGQEPAWTPILGGQGWGKPGSVNPEQPYRVLSETPTQQPVEQPTPASEQTLIAMPANSSTLAPIVSIGDMQSILEFQVQKHPSTTTSASPNNGTASVAAYQSASTNAPSVIPAASSTAPPYQASPIAQPSPTDAAYEEDDTCAA